MQISYYFIPVLVFVIFTYSFLKKKNAYDSFIIGAKEGIQTSVQILPFLLSMYVAVNVLNASGLIQDVVRLKNFPIEIIIQAIFKPFSSNASMSFMIDCFETYGVDSNAAMVSSIMQASTDTTFYIVALYFGSVGILNYRYTIKVGLLTDIFCFLLCILLFYIL